MIRILLLCLHTTLWANEWFYDHQLSWLGVDSLQKPVEQLCQNLKASQKFELQCFHAGEIQRNENLKTYLIWLNQNLRPQALAEDLLPRDLGLKKRLFQVITDDWIYCSTIHQNCLWISQGSQIHVEVLPLQGLSSGRLERKLKEAHQGLAYRPDSLTLEYWKNEPDLSFQFQPKSHFWTALSVQWNQGWGLRENSQIAADLQNLSAGDSTQLWNWIQENRFYQLNLGNQYADLFHYSFLLGLTQLEPRLSSQAQDKVQDWNWTMWWWGVSLSLGKQFEYQNFIFNPHLSLGLAQYRLIENFTLKQNSLFAQKHFIPPNLKGADLAVGMRLKMPWSFWLNYEWGLLYMSRSASDDELGNKQKQALVGDQTRSIFHKFALEFELN